MLPALGIPAPPKSGSRLRCLFSVRQTLLRRPLVLETAVSMRLRFLSPGRLLATSVRGRPIPPGCPHRDRYLGPDGPPRHSSATLNPGRRSAPARRYRVGEASTRSVRRRLRPYRLHIVLYGEPCRSEP